MLRGFGVEIEIPNCIKNGKTVESQVLTDLMKRIKVPGKVRETYLDGYAPRSRGDQWEVKCDSSVGHEIVTPILAFDKKGFKHFEDFAKNLQETLCAHFEVSPDQFITPKGGIHVHFSKSIFNQKHMDTLFRLFLQYEYTIYQFFPRFRKTARHNMPIRPAFNERLHWDVAYKPIEEKEKLLPKSKVIFDNNHCYIVNLSYNHPTVEIRHSHTTVESDNSAGWVKFLFLLIHTAEKHPEFCIQFRKNNGRFQVNPEFDTLENLLSVLKMKNIPARWLQKDKENIFHWMENRTQENRIAA